MADDEAKTDDVTNTDDDSIAQSKCETYNNNDDDNSDVDHPSQEGVEMTLEDGQQPPSCCSRFLGDWKLPFFDLSETDGSIIDVTGSFAPLPFWRTLLVKAVIFGLAISVLVLDMLESEPVRYYFMFLSSWSLLVANLYLMTSLMNTVCGVPDQRPYDKRPSFFIRLAWGLYPTAITTELASTVFFWAVVYSSGYPMDWITVMKNVVIPALILFEGHAVNCVPVRMKHLVFPMVFAILFVIWSVIHSYANIGNPYSNVEDPEQTDNDATRPSLNWKDQPTESFGISAILVFGVTPFLFLNIWLLSVWSFPFHFDGTNRPHYYFKETEKK